jgi:hypothetical protein
MIDPRPGVDRLILPAQFGVRLLDAATGRTVSDGLELRLWPSGRPERAAAAVANHQGIFVAHPLSGHNPPPQWTVEVVDKQGRFLPLRFTAELPSTTLQDLSLLSPPFVGELPAGGVVLFSAPTRSLPPGLAALSAQLRDMDGDPTAWAIAKVQFVDRNGATGPTLGWGMADAKGNLLVPIQTPRVRSTASGPNQSWIVRLTVCSETPPGERVPTIPTLDEVLRQPEAMLMSTLSPLEVLDELDMQAGQTLVLRTAGVSELLLSR